MHAVEKPLTTPSFDDVVALVQDDMRAVDRLISKSLESDVPLVSQVSEYIVMSGGKELALELEEKGYDWIKADIGQTV